MKINEMNDNELFNAQVMNHANLQVAYRLKIRAEHLGLVNAEARHRRTIARLHVEQEAIGEARKALV